MTGGSGTKAGSFELAGDDRVVPFEVAALDVRGRAVQLGALIERILERHDYPEPVGRVLAEAVVLTVLVGTSLKFDGKLILQTRTDGPVELLVADFSTPHAVRGYARFDTERLEQAVADGALSTGELLGNGVLALTIDQGAHTQRYQGIVQLESNSFEDVARIYFRQSEQIPTEVRLAVTKQVLAGEGAREHWRAGGLLSQFLPQAPERRQVRDLPGGDGDEAEGLEDDAWRELVALMDTIEPDELFDPTVGTERLLYRLFNEHGVRVFDPVAVRDECSCSRDKIRSILQGFSAEEIDNSIEDGEIKVSCEFCGRTYVFDPAEFGADAPARGASVSIRSEHEGDFNAIDALLRQAFGEEGEASLVRDLRETKAAEIALVAEAEDGQVVGHVLVSALTGPFRALALAPLAVAPDRQRQGIGTTLVKAAIRAARESGWAAIFVLGDPAYYGRFGFSADAAKGFASPHSGPHLMALALDGALPVEDGEITYPPAFNKLG